MYFHNVAGTGSYTTSSTNVYNKDQTYTAFRRREHVFQTVQCQRRWLKISKIEKNVSIDHTRHCIQTSNQNKKNPVRINSTFKVIRKCIFIMLAVLEVTQRVPPTCIIQTSRTPWRG
jgi:hypothetical protein